MYIQVPATTLLSLMGQYFASPASLVTVVALDFGDSFLDLFYCCFPLLLLCHMCGLCGCVLIGVCLYVMMLCFVRVPFLVLFYSIFSVSYCFVSMPCWIICVFVSYNLWVLDCFFS